jgi:hypothetical protein
VLLAPRLGRDTALVLVYTTASYARRILSTLFLKIRGELVEAAKGSDTIELINTASRSSVASLAAARVS